MMNRISKNKQGIILAITVTVMAVMVIITYAFLYMSSTQSRVVANKSKSAKALWLAEAGMEKYLYLLKTDSNYRTNTPDLSENLASGDYSVSAVYNSGTDTYAVVAKGTSGTSNRMIGQSAQITVGSDAFGNAIFIYGARLQFDNTFGVINGDVTCVGELLNNLITINGTLTEFASVPGPFPPDYNGYRSIADHTETGNYTFTSGQTVGSPGNEEVWVIEGRVVIQDNVTIYGSIIAPAKTITMDGSANLVISPASGMPAIVGGTYIDGDYLTDATINGLIYSGKDLRINNMSNVTINGSIMAENVCTFQNGTNVTINYDPTLASNPPPFFSGYAGNSITLQDDWTELPTS